MAVIRGSDVLEASQVRIYSAAGEVIGAGFLVADDVVCTCAHVVAEALCVPDATEQAPCTPLDLDFPLLAGRPRARATVVSWRHGGSDVALLRFNAEVPGARPAPLAEGTDVWGHTFRAFGYPADADDGVWASGTLRAGQGSGWLQMEADASGPRIAEGFSGAPVWDDAQDGVVGMTVAEQQGERTAYLLPSTELVDEGTLPPRCPFQGLAAFTENDAEFFHGRDNDAGRVHRAVRSRPVTLVAGPSGCGKSSLVRAGVLPRLHAEGMSAYAIRPVTGARAATVLARALTGVLEPELSEVDRLAKAEDLARLLDGGDGVVAELRSRILACSGTAGHVLFVDQLEEYVVADPAAARELLALMAELAGPDGAASVSGSGAAGLRIVATARPDSLDLLVTADTSDLVSDSVQFLAPLAADDLLHAVTGPVAAVPGLWFEPGLPERIVADAGDEPGRMPLVQFALTELWKRRTRSTLTHAAYNELGGVAGALVGYADDALAGLKSTQQDSARRLFVQLARPGDGDTFPRSPVRTADLAPELLDLARELAPSKLVVLSHASGAAEPEEIVELAHEALTALWPRLRQWLVDSRDFRLWQEQLRTDLRRWQAQGGEPARLLSGTDLAEATHRLAENSEDISADERGYIHLSRRRSRRGARLKQAAVGALAALTVLAVVLAFSTWQSLQRTEQQLRIQAAGLLAQAAEDRPGSDPATALQLALAAWNTRQTTATRQALLHQYTREQYLVGSYPSVWQGRVTGMDATPDGRTLVVRSRPSGGSRLTITAVSGVLQGKPKARQLNGVPEGMVLKTAISPDGRFFAASGGEGLQLWRLDDPQHPTVLHLGNHELPEKAGASLDFSSDGMRLLLTMDDNSMECFNGTQRCIPAFAEAWNIPSGTRIHVPGGIVPETGLKEAAFTEDADTVATISYTHKQLRQRIEVRDFTTGRLRYTYTTSDAGGAELQDGGELLVRTDTTHPYALALSTTPGHKTALPTSGSGPDATSRYGVDNTAVTSYAGPTDGGYAEPTLTDLRTGHTYRTRIPTSGDTPAAYTGVAAVPRTGGGLTVLVPVGTTLMAVRADPAGGERFEADTGNYSLSPDGRYIALATDRRLEVLDASRTRHQSVSLPMPAETVHWIPTWTADSKRIVVWGQSGNLYRSYSVQNLHDSVPLDDVMPKAKALDRVTEWRGGEVDSVAALQGSEIVLLTVEGRLARVDAADSGIRTQPFLVHPAPNWAGILTGDLFAHVQLIARPGHPGQVAAVTMTGNQRGEILLWDVRAPRRIATLPGPAISVPFGTVYSYTSALAFDTDGSHLAVQNTDGQVHVWDVDRRKQLAGSVPRRTNDTLVGFGPGDSVVTYLVAKKQVQIYDLTSGESNTVAIEGGDWITGFVHGHRLTIDTGRLRQTFDLRPDIQFHTLCDAVGRDYTKAERKLLPKGTPSKAPCT